MRADEVRRARQQGEGRAGRGVAARAYPASPRAPRVRPMVVPQRPEPARRRWSRRRMALFSFPAIILALLAVLLVPIVLEARQAYDQIFVPPQPRPTIVEVNGQAVIVDPTAAAESGQPREPAIPAWDGKERLNILLLGVDDRRDGETPRSDTMIIVSIDPGTKQVGMLSIPRDLLVEIPNHGQEKINAAYPFGTFMEGIGGPGLVRATIEWNFDIEIHYYAEVDFEGFEKIVDTLGGLIIDVPAPIKDDAYPGEETNYTRIYFHTGPQHMDGQTALRYARTRHDDNDFARGDRQQQVLRAMREQGVRLGLITKATQLLNDFGDTFRTDLAPRDTLSLALLGTEIKGEDIHSYSLLTAVSERVTPSGYYLIPDWAAVQEILAEMMAGRDQTRAGAPEPVEAGSPEPEPEPDPTATPRQVDYGLAILVQNATYVNLLASANAEILAAEGFTNIATGQSSETGNYPESRVIDYTGNLATARFIADALGLPPSAVVTGDPAFSGGYDIIVVMGDDAPTPGG